MGVVADDGLISATVGKYPFMNPPFSAPLLLPIRTLLCACCLLPAGCATHQPGPQTAPPPAAPTAQPVVVSTPAANTISPRPVYNPAQSAPAPATSAHDSSPHIGVPLTVLNAKPEKLEAAKRAALKPAPNNAEPGKPATHKPESVTTAPPRVEPVIPTTENLAVDLNTLPMSIHGQWTLDRDEARCTLHSANQQMDDGQGGTRISLLLSANELSFLTESDIDTSYSGTGITIDDGEHFALETVEHRTNPAFTQQRSALLNAMKNGQNLQLTLGFWPTWPVTHTWSVRFPLQHFATAYAAWESCNGQLNPR